MDRRTRDAIGLPRAWKKDMKKAILTAKHPKDSKFGECLLNLNTKDDPVYNSKLRRLKTEMRRMNVQVNQIKEHFVRRSQVLNYEPMILVERPPTSSVPKPDDVDINGLTSEEIEDLEKPGYMRRLRSRCKTPVSLLSIDAFTKRVSKKRNIWEDLEDDDTPCFTNTIRPYCRLRDSEVNDLKNGWNHHKPHFSQDSCGKRMVHTNKYKPNWL